MDFRKLASLVTMTTSIKSNTALLLAVGCLLFSGTSCRDPEESEKTTTDAPVKIRRAVPAEVPLSDERDSDTDFNFRIDLLQLSTQRRLPEPIVVSVQDPIYGKIMTYRGYLLNDILRNSPGWEQTEVEEAELVFRCADNYLPTMPLHRALKARGVLAYRDEAMPSGGEWESFLHGGVQITPGPFYLVWEDVSAHDDNYPWPYQIIEISIITFDRLQAAYPHNDSAAEAGFLIFKRQCARCHSMNLAGGTMGPELNVPKNITEYWEAAHLRAFIKNASDYHARTTMPSFPNISNEEMDHLLYYLRVMRLHKIKIP